MTAHPYMPNSTPELERELLDAIGVADVEELFAQIPADHRLQGRSSCRRRSPRRRRCGATCSTCSRANETCERNLSFLGGGFWQHHVPAVVRRDRGAQRVPDSRLGNAVLRPRPQPGLVRVREPARRAVGMDFVGLPVYSWGCAAGHAIRMAARLTGRDAGARAARRSSPERLAVIRTYCAPPRCRDHIEVDLVGHDPATGGSTSTTSRAKLSARRPPPCYFENPGYLGTIEAHAAEIARSPTRSAPRPSSASTRSRSACSRRRPPTAPTSSSAASSRSAST